MLIASLFGVCCPSAEEEPANAAEHHTDGQTGTGGAASHPAARKVAAFWNTGEARYAEAHSRQNFVDRTLP